jgi:methionyl-tRNA formyltransferase
MGIIFIGSQQIGHDCLQQIIQMKIKVDAIFTFKPEKHEEWKKSVDIIAEKEKIPLFFPENLTIEKITEINPELIIVAGYRKLFSEEILQIPKKGIIGLHASLLPNLRGLAPLNWAIINDERKTGITMFFMNKLVDRGNIIAQKEIEIIDEHTIVEIKEKISQLAVELIKENIIQVLDEKVISIKQSEEGTYGCKRIPEDGIIDWSKNNREIFNLIRGLEPSYPAFTFYKSDKLYIKKAKLNKNNYKYFGMPGQVAQIFDDGSINIITGDGLLRVLKINFKNDEVVDAKTILNSYSIRLG